MPDPIQTPLTASPGQPAHGEPAAAPQTPPAAASPAGQVNPGTPAPEPESELFAELQALLDADSAKTVSVEPVPPDSPAPAPSTPGDSAAPSVATPPTATPQAQPAAPVITDAMIDRARNVGISEADARAYGTPAMLERTVAIFEKNLQRVHQHFTRQQTPPAAAPGATPPAPAQGATPPASEGTPTPPAPGKFTLNIDERMYDPEIVKAMRDMNEHYANVVAAQAEQLKEVTGKLEKVTPAVETLAQQQARAADQQRDAELDSLFKGAEGLHDIVGSQSIYEIPSNSPQRVERGKIYRQMIALAKGAEAIGDPVPNQKVLFEQAVRILHGDRAAEKAKAQETAKLAQQIRDERGRYVQRPSEIHQPNVSDPNSPPSELRDLMRRAAANGQW